MSKKKHDIGTIFVGKSPYGSHKSLVIERDDVNLEPDEVLCKDERGVYKTSSNRLDNGLADPNRWSPNRKNY